MSESIPFEPALVDAAVALAAELQTRAAQLQSSAEKKQQAELDRMLQHPHDKATLVQLTDQAFRSQGAARTAEQFAHILDVQGIPRFFSPLDQALLGGFQAFGGWLPSVTVPLVKAHLQHETANVVLPAEPDLLHEHLAARKAQGVRMNLNLLGEALLGEEEAMQRLRKYLETLNSPEVEVMSVKISTIYSQIWPLAQEHTLDQLCQRMELLYRQATRAIYTKADGSTTAKFVYLDMEEYRDLPLTAEVFMRTLSKPGLANVRAGIALQAYVPDSFAMQKRITAWAMERVAKGGSPVTIRIVKGANMEMERIDAALHDWEQAPFRTKQETDANYKRMLQFAMQAENLAAVQIGVASHNLFDVAYGLILAQASGAGESGQFEMLEGMANHQRRALLEKTQQMLLYAPACRKEEFLHAIGYLIRRLDENTGPENFLGHAFRLTVGSDDWKLLERGFREAFKTLVGTAPQRKQDRNTEKRLPAKKEMLWNELENEPDTDWSLSHHADWGKSIVERDPDARQGFVIPIVLGGIEVAKRSTKPCLDPSRPGKELCLYALATSEDVQAAVACAQEDVDGWRSLTVNARNKILGEVAAQLRASRGDLLHAALQNGGKLLSEGDPEVSEAIDFVEFYRSSARRFYELQSVEAKPVGVVVVVPPWNFPIAIPCGGIAAALAAGNTVILKPASDTVLVAWELCQCFWRAGVSKKALQFLPCPGRGAGSELVSHPGVNVVILTGGTETALQMLKQKPEMHLSAETGGKNATIITALSDHELAIKHVLHSAFGHGGQKCSATSLLLLEAEIYDDPGFKRMLCDAVRSLYVGSAYELHSRMAPLIHAPSGALEEALKTLEPGESWAVLPRTIGNNENLWTPGVKYGVTLGSFTHRTEFFGPVLGVMRFEKLEEAVEMVNGTGYGLTSAIHSLDDREIEVWKEGIQAGNLYINRGTTGAIVLRQPFGGVGLSCIGPGLKAGGPNYVAGLMNFADTAYAAPAQEIALPEIIDPDLALLAEQLSPAHLEDQRLLKAIRSYDTRWREEFSLEHDHFKLLGQDNLRRYRPFREITLRLLPQDSRFERLAMLAAARITGSRIVVSFSPDCPTAWQAEMDKRIQDWADPPALTTENEEALVARLQSSRDWRIRLAAANRVSATLRNYAAKTGIYLATTPVSSEGLVELLWYLSEQSISYDYHRYGNLGVRAGEVRRKLVGE